MKLVYFCAFVLLISCHRSPKEGISEDNKYNKEGISGLWFGNDIFFQFKDGQASFGFESFRPFAPFYMEDTILSLRAYSWQSPQEDHLVKFDIIKLTKDSLSIRSHKSIFFKDNQILVLKKYKTLPYSGDIDSIRLSVLSSDFIKPDDVSIDTDGNFMSSSDSGCIINLKQEDIAYIFSLLDTDAFKSAGGEHLSGIPDKPKLTLTIFSNSGERVIKIDDSAPPVLLGIFNYIMFSHQFYCKY